MDFVVVGFGIGSICILAGLVLRDAPGWWARRPGRRPEADDLRTARLGRALGNVILVGGIALAVVTLAALFTGLSDGAGALLVASAVTVVAIGLVAWAMRWRRRYPPPSRHVGDVAAPPPLAVAIERGLAREGLAAGAAIAGAAVLLEADEAVEASGLNVERIVLAQERGEIAEPAEAAGGEHEAAERHAGAAEHHRPAAAHLAEPPAASAAPAEANHRIAPTGDAADHHVVPANGDAAASAPDALHVGHVERSRDS
ncbi:MAG TPA: hypothetical protein VFQ80_08785 [Thermomicrobiales bacterium]|nr:hypothetical protein [Thermomicrobiales bacterium]